MIARYLPGSWLVFALASSTLIAACSESAPPAGSGGSSASGGSTAGGGSTGSGGAAADPTIPADTSQAGIEAFLAAGSYKSAPWIFDSAVRESTFSTNPHNRVRVYYNPTAVASISAGNNDVFHETGNYVHSMVIKEIYDDADVQLGTALMLRLDETEAGWLYYCSSPEHCTLDSEDTLIYETGAGIDNPCSICHGGTFIAPLPE